MRLDSTNLVTHLKKELRSIYVIHGVEPLLAQESLDLLVQCGKDRQFLVRETHVVDTGFDWSFFLNDCRSQSLFAAQKIIDLRIPNGKPGTQGADALIELVEHPPQDSLVIISLPRIDNRTQKTKWFEALEHNSVIVQCNLIDRSSLPRWISQRFLAQEQSITEESAEFIAQRVEGNLLAAHQEIQKLKLLFPDGQLSQENIEQSLVDVSRYQVFDLMPCLYKRDLLQYERILNGLRAEAEGLPLILWALNEDIHLLLKCKELETQGIGFQQLSRQLFLKPIHNKYFPALLANCSTNVITTLIKELHLIDTQVKGVGAGNPWQSLAYWGLLFIRGTRKNTN